MGIGSMQRTASASTAERRQSICTRTGITALFALAPPRKGPTMPNRHKSGVSPSGPGSRPSGRASKAVSPVPASIPNAETFARSAHDGQRYGGKPYVWHLEAVVQVLRDAGYADEYLAAGWLHDVSEDVGVSISTLRRYFGDRVADLVKACTGVGRNRKERNACIYDRIASYPDAAVVKVADRIANVEAAQRGSSHAEMYLKEAIAFHENVAVHAPESLRRRLNRAYTNKRTASAIETRSAKTEGLGPQDESAVAKPDAQGGQHDT